MSLTEDQLELLIGKCLDHQATPMEQHLIEKEMNQNPKAKELYEQWQTLNEWGRELVVDRIVGQGASPADVFERAWRRSRGLSLLRLVQPQRHLKFAVGMAAGLVLGLILHFTLVWTNGTTGEYVSRRGPVAAETTAPTRVDQPATPNVSLAAAPQPESRNPESYFVHDKAGNVYEFQRVHEVQKKVQLAAYSL